MNFIAWLFFIYVPRHPFHSSYAMRFVLKINPLRPQFPHCSASQALGSVLFDSGFVVQGLTVEERENLPLSTIFLLSQSLKGIASAILRYKSDQSAI